jgi:uracil-DNA glycosylase
MQGSLEKLLNQNTVEEFANNFIKPLIEMVNPKIIITLGLLPYRGIQSIFGDSIPKSRKLKDMVEQEPIKINKNLLLFPMFHCGSLGVNKNRSLVDQKRDWLKIRPYLKHILI